jgi:hypothetical protein
VAQRHFHFPDPLKQSLNARTQNGEVCGWNIIMEQISLDKKWRYDSVQQHNGTSVLVLEVLNTTF